MRLIIGLGNPGKAYAGNRHNVGFRCVDLFAAKHGISMRQRKAHSQVGVGVVHGESVALAKPRTFMNLSGDAAAALMRRYRVRPDRILVIYDDLDLPLGKIRVRERGGSGGHKGVESIISRLASQDFPRLRVGIASQTESAAAASDEVDAVEYVLSDFASAERPVLRQVVADACAAVECLLTEGIAAAMNKYN
jgi:PTH1 family peptidyl-tRNA hydrolase